MTLPIIDVLKKYPSLQAFLVGGGCYMGLKIHRYNPDNHYGAYLGKVIVTISIVTGLYFSGIVESEKNNIKYWIPLPLFNGLGISISLSTVTDSINHLFNRIYG